MLALPGSKSVLSPYISVPAIQLEADRSTISFSVPSDITYISLFVHILMEISRLAMTTRPPFLTFGGCYH